MSDPSAQFEYLSKLLDHRIDRLETSVNRYRHRYFITQMSTVAISGLVTVLAGTKGTWLNELVASNLILVFSAIITIVSAWGAFFSSRETWHLKAATQGKICALRNRLKFAHSSPRFEENGNELCEEILNDFEKVMTEHNQHWLELRKK
jgi:hypothetical protein